MIRNTILIALAALLAVTFTHAVVAAEIKGNKRKGKYTYRKVYKACFERGEATQAKPVINPDAKTQVQWTQTFEGKKFDQFGCQPEWSALNEQQLLDIYTYLHAHAADSPTPAKCK